MRFVLGATGKYSWDSSTHEISVDGFRIGFKVGSLSKAIKLFEWLEREES